MALVNELADQQGFIKKDVFLQEIEKKMKATSDLIEDLELTQEVEGKLQQAGISTVPKLKDAISQGRLDSTLDSSGFVEVIQKLEL